MKLFKKLFLMGVASLIFIANLFAQAPDTLWTKTFGGADYDWGISVQETSDSGYIIAGMTLSFGAGSFDAYLIKTNATGETLWTKTYGGNNYDFAASVQQTSDGGYIIAGMTFSFGAGLNDVWLIKTDSFGDSLWARTFGGTSMDASYSVQQTIDGGYIIVGWTESFGRSDQDVYLIKTDSSGNDVWAKTYGGSGNDQGFSVVQTSDSGYIIVGNTRSFGPGDEDVYLLKTDKDGDLLWDKTYGGTNYDAAYSVKQTIDGGYIIAGYTESFGVGASDIYLVKTDSIGDTIWTRTFGGEHGEGSNSVENTADSGYIVAGWTGTYGVGMGDVYLVKTDAKGDTLWTKTIGGDSTDYGLYIEQTFDKGYIIVGSTSSFGAGLDDIYLIKTKPDVSVEEGKQNQRYKTRDTKLLFHPNPFTSSTTISFTCLGHSAEGKELKIYDITGRLVKKLSLPTAYSLLPTVVTWDGRDAEGKKVNAGIYFLKLDDKPAGKVMKVR